MKTLSDAAREFLAQESIAVAGVSRGSDAPANYIYRQLRIRGHSAFAVNPNADTVEGAKCYRRLADVPGPIGGLVIATHPDAATELVKEASTIGIRRIWMHRSFGTGSVDSDAVDLANSLGIAVIPGSCPMMHGDTVDFPHKCMRLLAHWVDTEPTDADIARYFANLDGARTVDEARIANADISTDAFIA